MSLVIVDLGIGNLGSVANMLKKVGAPAEISRDPAVIASADKLILPGVGAFDPAMQRLNESGLRPVLERRVIGEGVPLLGICLGMQLLTAGSEEGTMPGLGWVRARTLAFRGRVDGGVKVPHMGWNRVDTAAVSPLTAGFEADEEPRFYFVHSYFVRCENGVDGILRTTYGVTFDSGVQHGRIMGVQFHPEKSHRFGMRLLANFAAL
jgi:glutamine amidotransferase